MLCARAQIDRSDYDSRYSDLEECFFAAYAAEFGRYRRAAEAARAGHSAWRDRLRATAYALLRFLAEDERVTHFTVVEVRRGGERSALLIGEGVEELIDLLDEGRNEPGAPTALTRATAESLAGGLFNQLYVSVAHGDKPNESQIVPPAMYAAVLPYLGPAAAQEELEMAPPAPPVRSSELLPDPRDPLDRALIELCYEKGSAALSIEQLCDRADLTRDEFDSRYADFEDCFCAVFERELDLLLIDFNAVLAEAEGWRSRLRAVAYHFHHWLTADPARTHLMVNEIRSAGRRAQEIQWRGIQAMIDLLDEGRESIAASENLTKATAEALAGGILNQIYAAARSGGQISSDTVPRILYTAFLPYIGPEAAAEELVIAPPHPPVPET